MRDAQAMRHYICFSVVYSPMFFETIIKRITREYFVLRVSWRNVKGGFKNRG